MKIDKNIPIPKVKYRQAGTSYKYPFLDLQVGDSFFVECSKERKRAVQSTVVSIASRLKKKYKRSFISRNLEGGIRVWRVPYTPSFQLKD